jgi:hypothetical protein
MFQHGENRLMNYLKALKTYVEMLRPNLEAVREDGAFLYLILKHEAIVDRDKFSQLHMALKLLFKDAVSIHAKAESGGFKVNLTILHARQLKDYFNKDVSREEVAESINFLLAHGWTEKQLQDETGVSRATAYRYQHKTQPSQSETDSFQP